MINFESKWLLVASVALSSFACSLKEASTNPLAAEPDNVGEVDESGAGGGARVTSASAVASVRTLPPQSSAAGGVSSVNQVTPGTTAVVVSSVSSSGANQSNAAAGGATQRSSAAGGAIQNSSVTPAGGSPSVSLGSGGMGVSTLTLASSTTAKPVESVGPIGSGGTSAAPVSGAEEVTPLGLGGVTPTSESKRQLPAHWVTGYYVGYQSSKHPPSEIDFSALSHLVMGAALVKADGSVDLSFYVGDANAGGTLARDVAKRAHAAGKLALLMVGGAGNGAAIASAVKNRFDVFVSNLVKAVTDLGYDGLDLDWEDSVDMPQFVSLAKALRAKMPNAILTVPGFTVNPNYQTVDPATKQLVGYLDQYNLMSYFPATAMAGGGWLSWHNSPLCGQKATTPVTIEDSLKRFTDAGVPKSKLGMGVAFYAICYTSGVTAPNQSTEGVSIMGGDNDFPVSELLGGTTAYPSSARHWDAQAQVPYLALSSADRRGCKYVSYDDEESLAAKGTFAKQGGYGGIIVWTISQGYMPNRAAGQRNPLMQALKKSFLD